MHVHRNSFHGTNYISKYSAEEIDTMLAHVAQGTATKAEKYYLKRMRDYLCGAPDCKCHDGSGRR